MISIMKFVLLTVVIICSNFTRAAFFNFKKSASHDYNSPLKAVFPFILSYSATPYSAHGISNKQKIMYHEPHFSTKYIPHKIIQVKTKDLFRFKKPFSFLGGKTRQSLLKGKRYKPVSVHRLPPVYPKMVLPRNPQYGPKTHRPLYQSHGHHPHFQDSNSINSQHSHEVDFDSIESFEHFDNSQPDPLYHGARSSLEFFPGHGRNKPTTTFSGGAGMKQPSILGGEFDSREVDCDTTHGRSKTLKDSQPIYKAKSERSSEIDRVKPYRFSKGNNRPVKYHRSQISMDSYGMDVSTRKKLPTVNSVRYFYSYGDDQLGNNIVFNEDLNDGPGAISSSSESDESTSISDEFSDEQTGSVMYDFSYSVNDEGKNEFEHKESRKGAFTTGEYSVKLPDGRHQTVSYSVNGIEGSGYHANVKYNALPIS